MLVGDVHRPRATALIAAGADVQILSLKAPLGEARPARRRELLSGAPAPALPPLAAFARARAFAAHPVAMSRAMGRISARLARQPTEVAKSLEALGRGVEHLVVDPRLRSDVIHAHWGTYPSTVAWALGRILKKPFGMTCHAHDIFVNDHLLREKIESADVGVTISRFNVSYLSDRITPRAKRSAPRRSLRRRSLRDALPWRTARAGLDPGRGAPRSHQRLRRPHRRARPPPQGRPKGRLQLIGQGPLEGMIRGGIAQHGIGDSVELAGAVPQAEVRAALYKASIFGSRASSRPPAIATAFRSR